jgi:hypothetical protein
MTLEPVDTIFGRICEFLGIKNDYDELKVAEFLAPYIRDHRQVLGPSPIMNCATIMEDYETYKNNVQEAFVRAAGIPKSFLGGIP